MAMAMMMVIAYLNCHPHLKYTDVHKAYLGGDCEGRANGFLMVSCIMSQEQNKAACTEITDIWKTPEKSSLYAS